MQLISFFLIEIKSNEAIKRLIVDCQRCCWILFTNYSQIVVLMTIADGCVRAHVNSICCRFCLVYLRQEPFGGVICGLLLKLLFTVFFFFEIGNQLLFVHRNSTAHSQISASTEHAPCTSHTRYWIDSVDCFLFGGLASYQIWNTSLLKTRLQFMCN